MKTKKAGFGVLVVIIIVVLIIGIVVTLLIMANQKGWISKQKESEERFVKFYFKTLLKNEPISANYRIETYSINPVEISSGIISAGELREMQIPSEKIVHLACWNNMAYLTEKYFTFTQKEKFDNLSHTTCDLKKIGRLEVKHNGDLEGLGLNITTDYWFNRIGICAEWSAGIIDVTPRNKELICNYGNWENYTFYNATSKQYSFLESGYYRCGECNNWNCNWIEKCDKVIFNRCEPFEMEIPLRYKGLVDRCWYFGDSLYNKSKEYRFNIKSDNLNQLDYVKFIIIDFDKRFDKSTNTWNYVNEEKGIDIGHEDIMHIINYED